MTKQSRYILAEDGTGMPVFETHRLDVLLDEIARLCGDRPLGAFLRDYCITETIDVNGDDTWAWWWDKVR